jgi:hypothetical protein
VAKIFGEVLHCSAAGASHSEIIDNLQLNVKRNEPLPERDTKASNLDDITGVFERH